MVVEIVLSPRDENIGIVLDAIRRTTGEISTQVCDYLLYGVEGTFGQIEDTIKARGRRSFNIRGRGFEFEFSLVANSNLEFFRIKNLIERTVKPIDWLNNFLDLPNFTMAWVFNEEYDYWQNATSIEQYAAANRPYKDLPLKSNGLPPPVHRMEIDISSNPGRRVLRYGYIEAVGSRMWLGRQFWALSGADREKLSTLDFLDVTTTRAGVTQVLASENCFKSALGGEGRLQNSLRAVLFPASAMPS